MGSQSANPYICIPSLNIIYIYLLISQTTPVGFLAMASEQRIEYVLKHVALGSDHYALLHGNILARPNKS